MRLNQNILCVSVKNSTTKNNLMKILFLCTSNKDRSPALEKYFRDNHPEHEYKSAGINKYFTEQHQTRLVSEEDIVWADMVVAAELVHATKTILKFQKLLSEKKYAVLILDLGEFNDNTREDSLITADEKITTFIKHETTKRN